MSDLNKSPAPPLILASSSPYRAAALKQLGLQFDQVAPDVDESPAAGESGTDMALRLATLKADKVRLDQPGAVVIASDQVGICNDRILHKPGSFERALNQLRGCRGHTAVFYTALAVWNPREGILMKNCMTTELTFRNLDDQTLAQYLRLDEPYDCAGAFKIEARGITLFSRVAAQDPTALVGLPMIALCDRLNDCGITPLMD